VEFVMQVKSVLIGAALAAMVIVPANAADPGWITGGWHSFDARALKLDDVVGTVRVDVKDSGPVALQINGLPDRVKNVHVAVKGNTLVIESERIGTVWDWRHWFDFRGGGNKPSALQINVAVPRGMPLDIDETAGNVTIGNTMGPLKFSVQGYTQSSVGDVASADIDMAGAGRLTLGNVAGNVKIDAAGSGNIRIGNVGRLNADIAGSGSIAVGNIRGGVDVDIAGSGDFSAASVTGPPAPALPVRARSPLPVAKPIRSRSRSWARATSRSAAWRSIPRSRRWVRAACASRPIAAISITTAPS
jgi:hypothetical protein